MAMNAPPPVVVAMSTPGSAAQPATATAVPATQCQAGTNCPATAK
jgi:hypothetical protein